MKGNTEYKKIVLSLIAAIILISVSFGICSPINTEDDQEFVIDEKPEIDKQELDRYSTATFGVWCFWGPDSRVGVLEGVIRTRVGFQEVKDSIRDETGMKREAIQVDYDPDKVSYMELYEAISETGQHRELHPFSEFILAGRADQGHFLEGHEKLSKGYHKIYPNLDDFINSTAVARVNGYLFGYGQLDSLEDLRGLGLTEKGMKEVYEIWESKKK